MATANDIIHDVLMDVGVLAAGQTPLAEDVNGAFRRLNMIIGYWNSQRWLSPHLIDVYIPSLGLQSYTVGPGGIFNIGRPNRIEAAYFRQGSGVGAIDTYLDLIEAYEDYARISVKGQHGLPGAVFYDSGYPLGTIYFYPIPGPQYQIHLIVKQPLAELTDLNQQIPFPAEYIYALHWNLANDLLIAYDRPDNPRIREKAMGTLAQIKHVNTQVRNLRMPPGLTGRRGSSGNFTGYTGIVNNVFTFDQTVLGGGDYEQLISFNGGVVPGLGDLEPPLWISRP